MKRKKIKSILAVFMALVMVDTTVAINMPTSVIRAEATENSLESNGFTYSVNEEDNTAVITGYKELGPDIEIPSKLTVGEKEYKVTSIADNAFYECKSLERIKIPEGINSIGSKAFYNCYNLVKVEMPNTVETLGSYVFYGCTNLSDVNISTSVETINEYSFYNCSNLKKINIPEKVTAINNYAFYGCKTLNDLEIPNNVASLGNSVFSQCSSVTSVKVPNSVAAIGSNAFSGCASLVNIDMADSVTSIGESMLYGCTNLKDVKLSKTLTSIPNSCFYGCSNLVNIELPEKIDSLGESVFYNCTNLSSIDIPDNVSEIKINAFRECKKLSDVKLPKSLASIGDNAFYNCTSLKEIVMPEESKTIGNDSFHNCASLKTVIMSDSVTSIGTHCFDNCTSLYNLKISKNIATISDYSFYNCDALKYVQIPEGIVKVGQYAFYDCSGLISIEIPSTTTSIELYALRYCYSLTNIIFVNRSSTSNLSDSSYYYASNGSWDTKTLTSSTYNEVQYVKYGYGVKEDNDDCYYNLYYNNALVNNEVYNSNKTYNLVRRTISSEDYKVEKTLGNSSYSGKVIIKPTDGSNTISTYDGGYSKEIDITNATTSELTIYIKYANGEIAKGTIKLDKMNIDKVIPTIDVTGDLDTLGSSTVLSINKTTGVSGCKVTVSKDGGKEEEISEDTYTATSNGTYTFTITSGSGFASTKTIEIKNISNDLLYKYTVNEEDGTAKITSYVGEERNVIIPENIIASGKEYKVTSIGNSAFKNYSNMVTVSIPSTVVNIDNMAFYGCTSLSDIILPEGLTNIGNAAFAKCSGLTSVKIPDSIKNIGSSAFLNCTSLKVVNLPASNINAGTLLLGGSESLINVVLKNSVNTDVLSKAGLKIDNYYYKVNITSSEYNEVQLVRKDNGTNTMIVEDDDSYYNLYDGETLVTDYKINSDKKYTVVKKSASKDDYTVSGEKGSKEWYSTDVNIKASAEGSKISTDKSTWQDKITIKESLASDMSFYIKNSDGVISKGRIMKDDVKIDKSTPSIKAEGDLETKCDELNLKLTTVVGESGIEKVTVSKDGSKEEVIEGDNYLVKTKGSYVFTITSGNGLSSSTTLNISNVNLAINQDDYTYEFDSEKNTAVVTEYVGENDQVAIPSIITNEGKDFTVTGISDGAFLNKEVLTKVIIPDTIKEVSYCAFYGCSNLEKVEIPEGVTTISEMAFGECASLKSITIPSTITKVDSYCFEGCNNLDNIIIKGADSKELLGDTFNMNDYSVVKLTGDNYKEVQVVKNGTEFIIDNDKYNVYSGDEVVSDKVVNKDMEYRLEINK